MRAKSLGVPFTAAALFVFSSLAAQAAPIVTITHDYGQGAGKVGAPSLGAGTCDTLNANSITLRDSTGCQRFYDVFDFSGLQYDSITGFELELTFDSTNDVYIIFAEDWRVRPAYSATAATTSNSEMPALTRSGTAVTQTFTFDPSLSIFNSIVANEKFYLWFAENALGANSFNLHSASLTVHGEQTVPEPATLALLLAGGGALGLRRRFRR